MKFKYSAWFFILDQILRFLLLIAYLQDYFQKIHFLVFQYSLLFIVGLLYNYYKNKLEGKYSAFINVKYKDENPKITINEEIPYGLFIYQALFGFIFSFWFFYNDFESHVWYMYIVIFLFSLISAGFCILPLIFTIRYRESIGIISATPTLEKKN
ncbi:hypothetical protein OIU83_20570 [Flavobacterium sp. LS1R49]|uniref:Uncharacterized protein n=1 Tax=Flavobacterium shii TaxID=2987687 RepID=A0A9X2ZHU6_9FLAO|nr:hypothetical protein [Flavobacterium shii]